MKIRTIIFSIILFLMISPLVIDYTIASEPPPPPPHGSSGDIQGGGASIESGTFILIALGGIYGMRKLYQRRRKLID